MSLLKTEKPSMCWMGPKKNKKLFVEQHVLPPISWIAIVKTHNKKGKLIQIGAQLCSPGICFSILHLPMWTKGHLCTWALNNFFTGFLGRLHSTFQRHANGWRQDIMPGSKLTPCGSLAPLFLHSFASQRDYCNISELQYPHVSLWWLHSPNLTAAFIPSFS